MTRALGSTQLDALKTLARFNGGHWWNGCGWKWDTPSATVRILSSLVKRGLVEEIHDRLGEHHFAITQAGKDLIA